MANKLWYHEGLQFECTGCGDCCTGEPGHVWVNKAEIEAMAAAIDMEVEPFQQRYVRLIGIRKSLTERPGGDCVLYDAASRTCRVYEARPRQCRTWPFWSSNLDTLQSWQEIARDCPGVGSGQLVASQEIRSQRDVVRV
ncbi:MAG: YkgJ family cysteine cluster protein [Candidatus Nealsonbacteria bacterium]|nr:YkgJ family cysteine cluster protein [Candidatus Nealsonbacteria bacterium]